MENKYHFFWKNGLSQWTITHFRDSNNILYSHAEQYMMAEKARLFQDQEALQGILSSQDPRNQKSWGRSIKNFDPLIWELNREEIVLQGNRLRAKSDIKFKELLLSTEDLILVEASPFDRIWGIGYEARNALVNIDNWGLNLLGKTFMKLRQELRQ